MHRDELFFDLPNALIAQTPMEPRDHCKLMIVDKGEQTITHQQFFDLPKYLQPGDVLVFNQSKVLPARLLGLKDSGGKVEVVLLKDNGAGKWQCLIGGKISDGQVLRFGAAHRQAPESATTLTGTITKPANQDQTCTIQFSKQGQELLSDIQNHGVMPTPPYIKTVLNDQALYQTVYAKELGSAAAPTAGLHFTQSLLDALAKQGVQTEYLTLHVGLGTFQPVKTDTVEDHHMHHEWFSIDTSAWQRIQKAKQDGRRVIAVGTTSVRVLETLADETRLRQIDTEQNIITGETNIFIMPGYDFKMVDALVTNFHTPYSTLLALVYAFGGTDLIRNAYDQAIKHPYRFFSFGDAMLIQ